MKNQYSLSGVSYGAATKSSLILLLSALTLTGCGADSEPLALSVSNDSAATDNDAAITIEVLANDTVDPELQASIIAVSEPVDGQVEIVDGALRYTPNPVSVGSDSFNYTVSDTVTEATATVTVARTQSLTLAGRVVDQPIAAAEVTIEINGETFTATTDAEGNYELELVLDDLSDDNYPELSATGSGEQAYVTLSARLQSIQTMLANAGDDRVLVDSESNGVKITQLTTAENQQLSTLAQGEPLTDDNIQAIMSEFDTELMLEMAAAIKLLVDDPDFALPEGYDTIAEFLNDPEAYNNFVATAETSGALDEALTATLSDPAIQPQLDLTTLQGIYIDAVIGSRHTGRSFGSSIVVTDTALELGFYPEPWEYVIDGNKWLVENTNWSYTANFPRYYFADVDQAVLEAYLQAQGLDPANQFVPFIPASLVNAEFQVLTVNEEALRVLFTYEVRTEPVEFNYDGVAYTLPSVSEPFEEIQNWYPAAALDAQVAWDLNETNEFILPSAIDLNEDYREIYNVAPQVALATQHVRLEEDGTITNMAHGYAAGEWSLSADGRTLTTITPTVEYTLTQQLRWSRYDDVKELYVKQQITYPDSSETSQTSYAFARGLPVTDSLPIDTLSTGDGLLQVALLNMPADAWTDTGLQFAGEYPWAYGWEMQTAGNLVMAESVCENYLAFLAGSEADSSCVEDEIFWRAINVGLNETWAIVNEQLNLRRNFTSVPGCEGADCGGRFVRPVSVSESTGIVTVVEYEFAVNGSPYAPLYQGQESFLVDGGIIQLIPPRVNYWFAIDYAGTVDPAVATAVGLSQLPQALARPTQQWRKVKTWTSAAELLPMPQAQREQWPQH